MLPEDVFVQAVTITSKEEGQDKELLRAWIDPHKLKQVNGVWYKEGRRVITGSTEEKRNIIKSRHDPAVYGHPGISKMMQLVERDYWWPKMKLDIMDYIKGCTECQRHKVNNRPTRAVLSPIYPKPEAMLFETVAIDFITKLPLSQGYDSILTVTDHDCTKAAIFIPCNKEINAEETAALYMKQVVTNFGLPSKIISDRDPHFVSKFMRELCKLMGIEQNISMVYHPRTDGQSERTNQWLEQYLRFWVNHHQDNWRALLPMAEYAHNAWRNEMTKTTPYQTLMGYVPAADWRPINATVPTPVTRLEQWTQARQVAYEQMKNAQEHWAKAKREGRKFQKGDLVWLEGRNLKIDQPTTKLAAKRYGPFPVAQVLSLVTYQLTLPAQWKIHPVFHVDLLTPYKETAFHGTNYTRPPLDLINDDEEYEVEQILDSRIRGRNRKIQYLVKWVGYPDSDNQWLDAGQVTADDAIREFKERRPNAVTHLRRKSPH